MVNWLWSGVLLASSFYFYWQSRSKAKERDRYRSIVEMQEELILCWSKVDYCVTYANPAVYNLFQSDLVGQNIFSWIDRTDQERVKQKLMGLDLSSPQVKYKCRVILPDRSVRWQVWNHYLVSPKEVHGVGRDITENHLIEETLERFENRNRALIESIPDSMFIVDRGGNFIDFHARLPQEKIYRHLKEFPCFTPISDRILKLIDITLATQQLQTIEFSDPKTDIYYEARLVPSGQNEVMMLVRDITDRKQAEAIAISLRQEQEINQLQQHFFAMISHEFRTPLNVMAIAISTLENNEDLIKNNKIKRSIARIKNASDRILATIDNMMTIYQIKTDFFIPNWQSLNLNEFCQDLISRIDINNIYGINFYPLDEESSIISDPRLLSCILEQLLTNALKYSQAEVFMQVIKHPANVEIMVSDRGIGIPAGEVSHIFEPFFRASNVAGIHGSGLGLSLVQKCVEVCQGTIDVVSNQAGGTTFRIFLPITPQM